MLPINTGVGNVAKSEQFTETVSSAAKGEGTPGERTIRSYCDEGVIPCIRDAIGRRLLPTNAKELARQIYAERTQRRGRLNF